MCWQARFIHTGITLVGRTRGVKDGRRGQINLRDVQSRLRHTGTRLERLRVPLIRERKNDASWNEATWDQAMDFIAGRLDKIRREYGASVHRQLAARRERVWARSVSTWHGS